MDLPEAFVQMASKEHYKCAADVYRVTSLLKGVRETILERRHEDRIERDVSDMVWLLFGTAVHSILEQQQEADCELKEERLKVPFGDYIVSGQFDLYNADQKMITDYKTASVWKVIHQGYADWRRQLLIYAYMMRQYGFDVDKGQVIAFLKDHSKSEAKRKADYPELPVKKVCFKFTEQDFTDIKKWLYNRVNEIAEAEKLPDHELPICTPDERFNSGDKYAVMKGKNKRALRVLDSYEAAEKWMENNKKGTHIEIRPGEDKKCQDYCAVNMFCPYWTAQLEKGAI